MREMSAAAGHGDTVPHGIIENLDGVTDVVLAAMSRTPSPRLREVMAAFVRHLHAFAREVRLTQDEYDLAIDFLNRIGRTTTTRTTRAFSSPTRSGFRLSSAS